MFNIISSKPAINFTPGVFIDQISGYSVKFDKIYGEKGEKLKVFFFIRTQVLMMISKLLLQKGKICACS
jgi:hypothetical protein